MRAERLCASRERNRGPKLIGSLMTRFLKLKPEGNSKPAGITPTCVALIVERDGFADNFGV